MRARAPATAAKGASLPKEFGATRRARRPRQTALAHGGPRVVSTSTFNAPRRITPRAVRSGFAARQGPRETRETGRDGDRHHRALTATRGTEPLPQDAETRVAAFTELVATAVSSAQARADRARLMDEQAALGRVATLVAGALRDEVFWAVAREVGQLSAQVSGSDSAAVFRFHREEPALELVGVSDRVGQHLPRGRRLRTDEPLAAADVLRTGRSQRVDHARREDRGGVVAGVVRRLSIRSTVASPITVEGELWGAVSVASTQVPLPADTGDRLEKFAELVATAIANTQARDDLTRLAEEQAALRRVATLVARGGSRDEVFDAVAQEVTRLFRATAAGVVRYLPKEPRVEVVGRTTGPDVPLGMRLPSDDPTAVAAVLRTGQSARVDWAARGSRGVRLPAPRSQVVGREPDHGRRGAVGRSGHLLDRDAAARRYRKPAGEVQRAGRHGDREHRRPVGAERLASTNRGRGRRGTAARRARPA
jgi:GAF domain-containing protein